MEPGSSPARSSKELLMSTVLPDCCPSRQPRTLGTVLGSAELTLARVWWSLMFIRTSYEAEA
jgi:hypothetical protein